MPIPSGFEHLNPAGEHLATFTVKVGFNDSVKVQAPSRYEAERRAALPLPQPTEGGEK